MTERTDSGFAARGLVCIRGERMVFAGVDFEIAPGGLLLLTGPNGSGKSSLLRLLAGLLTPAAGTITWNGVPVAEDPEGHHARLRYVGHLDAVKPVLTVAENLTFWAGLLGSPEGAADAAKRALDRLGIDHLAEVPAQLLSAGQRRRLGLARLVASPSSLWLLDEPTVTLDIASVGIVETMIADHRAAGGLVIVATHSGIATPGATMLDLGEIDGVAA